ncbi:MAG: hypothetical protein ASARMPREDX12_004376 [Alectoria sarmentosa]|nr:MAG: hypothetical protein ASARMPREDX12_004376 [Alectoria sarmentosa]
MTYSKSDRLLLDDPRTEFAGPRSEVQGLHVRVDTLIACQGATKAEGYDDSAAYAASETPWKIDTTKTFSKSADDAPATNMAADRDLSVKPVYSDFHNCGIRHELCRPPKGLKPDELKHYYVNAFIPGRTVVNNHAFSDLLRRHGTQIERFMIPALMTLYLEQRKLRFVSTQQRLRVDEAVIKYHLQLWQTGDGSDPVDCLHFILIANQYIIIRPRLRPYWTIYIVPMLRSDPVQRCLQQHGNLGLRLKLNSHWILSDIAHKLSRGQPASFLWGHE